MAQKFKTLEDVKKAFKVRANGEDTLTSHPGFRYGDIDKHAHVLERLLETDYNTVSGFSFTELMEAMSSLQTNFGSKAYFQEYKKDSKSIAVSESVISEAASSEYFNEAFEGTTMAQAPFPVPAISLVTYQYEKSVIPYLAHQFDLKGNRGLVYYQEIKAKNTKGNITTEDLLGSPKEISKQPIGFVGTKVINETLTTTASGDTTYSGTFDYFPVQPGSVVITVEGEDGYFQDVASADVRDGEVSLLSVNGLLGTCTFKYLTGEFDIVLAAAPASAGLKIQATYNRDVETITGGTNNQAVVTVELASKALIAENFSVFTETNLYQEALSRAIFGLDWNSEVDNALAALYNKEVANKITSEIKAKIIAGSIDTHDISANISTGGNNSLFNTQFVAVVLGKLRKLIVGASGIACNKLSAIAVNIDVLPILEALPKYKAADAMFEETMGGMALVGLYDGVPVVIGYDPVLTAGEVIGLYKSKNKDFLTPYVFGTFVLPVIRDIFDQDNLAVNRKQLISSAAGEVVAERLAAKMTINGIDTIL